MAPDQRQQRTDRDGAIDRHGGGGGRHMDEQHQHGAALLVIRRGGETQVEGQREADRRGSDQQGDEQHQGRRRRQVEHQGQQRRQQGQRQAGGEPVGGDLGQGCQFQRQGRERDQVQAAVLVIALEQAVERQQRRQD